MRHARIVPQHAIHNVCMEKRNTSVACGAKLAPFFRNVVCHTLAASNVGAGDEGAPPVAEGSAAIVSSALL